MQLVSSCSGLRTIIILHPLGQFLIFHIIISLLQKLAQMRLLRRAQPFPSSVQHLMRRRHFFHAVKLRISYVININIPRRRIITTQNCISLFHTPAIFVKFIRRFNLRIRNIEHFPANIRHLYAISNSDNFRTRLILPQRNLVNDLLTIHHHKNRSRKHNYRREDAEYFTHD